MYLDLHSCGWPWHTMLNLDITFQLIFIAIVIFYVRRILKKIKPRERFDEILEDTMPDWYKKIKKGSK